MRIVEFKNWLLRGAYPRWYLPVLVVVVTVALFRFHLLLNIEVTETQARVTAASKQLEHLLISRLARSGGERNDVQRVLNEELALNSAIEGLTVTTSAYTAQATIVAPPSQVPAWFEAFVGLQGNQGAVAIPHLDDGKASLAIVLSPQPELVRIWDVMRTQLRISGLNIFMIFVGLTLMLRLNSRMFNRLAQATERFRSGELSTRMVESGTLEARAVAKTFNDMAAQIQGLVTSLQTHQHHQEAQLHFTRQLTESLPLPVFVRSTQGACLSVNKAWEELFGKPAARVIGVRMAGDLPEPSATYTGPERRTVERLDNEVLVKNAKGQMRELAYYSAPFTHTDGRPAGTIGTLVDITQRKVAQRALRAEKDRAQVTLSSIADAVITTDVRGRIDSLNEAAHFLTGFTHEEALGKPLAHVFKLDPLGGALAELEQALSTDGPVFARQQVLVHVSGERHAVEYTASPIRKSCGNSMGTVLVFRDVTETQDLQDQLTWQTQHDTLTGLKNRKALTERLNHALHTARHELRPLAVCLLDLDHFQAINEHHGVWTGDQLLKEVAARLMMLVGPRDTVARLGGDEFALLLGGMADAAAIELRVNQVLAGLAEPYFLADRVISTTASVGVSIFPLDDANSDILLRHAEQAMFQAKQTGRNCQHVFDALQDQAVTTHFIRQNRVAIALKGSELELYYQPKLNMVTGKVFGMEALLRWQHPEQGLLEPSHFLPTVENSDLSAELGEWVLREALRQMKRWASLGYRWTVSVNIAALHFHRRDFVDRLRGIMVEFPMILPGQIELEVLESAALADMQHMRQVMHELQALGVRFALDDFGTGFSSLSYLKALPAETIKIDQTFVRGIMDGRDDMTLVGAIVALAKAFDRSVVAEGVETLAQGQRLIALGCYAAQGFAISRPLPAKEVMQFARNFKNPFADNFVEGVSSPSPLV